MTASDAPVNHILADLEFAADFTLREEAIRQLGDALRAAPVSTQTALAAFRPTADPFQAAVIAAREPTVRIVAPAGSGKTQTIINRVLMRVREGTNPASILVLTFDNSAANSLREKLSSELDKLAVVGATDAIGGLTISTLNAYGYSILRDHLPHEYRPVVPDHLPRLLLRDVRQSLKGKSSAHAAVLPPNVADRFYLDFFGLLKNELHDPRALEPQKLADFMLSRAQARPFFAEAPNDPPTVQLVIQAVTWLYQAYDLLLRDRRYLDFDDQKLRAYACLAAAPDLLRILQSRLTEVVIDEFQDINRLDFELIRVLAERATLVVTGDDDQSIYGFRGCSPEYIINLEQHLGRQVSSYELQMNYRCPPNIVACADQLIRHNVERIPKNPVAHQTEPSQIQVVSSVAAGIEARSIVGYLSRIRRDVPGLQHRDIAILYRTNAQSLPLQVEMILSGIPYWVRKDDNILESEALERLLAIMRVRLALERGSRPSIEDQVQTVRGYFRWLDGDQMAEIRPVLARSPDFLEAVGSPEFKRALPKAGSSQLVPSLSALARAKSILDVVEVVASRFHGISGMVGSLEDALDQRVPLGEIAEIAANHGGGIEDFVRTMDTALKRARDVRAGTDDRGVALLTYFKSKGLQWHTVILTTCNQGLIPHWRAPIEDERRLFYVAMTRASANLLISYVATALNQKVAPSQFLGEAGLL